MGGEESRDGDIIRSRRALFIAAALSALSGAARAAPPKKPECKREEPASAEDEKRAEKTAKFARELALGGRHALAAGQFGRAFELTADANLALLAAKEWQVVGSPNEVIVWASAALECGLEGDARVEAVTLLASTKAAAAEIELRITQRPAGNEKYVDGQPVAPNEKTIVESVLLDRTEIDPAARIYVTPGSHDIEVHDNQHQPIVVSFEIAAGESRVIDVELPPPSVPRPCLQPPYDEEFLRRPIDPRRPQSRLILDLGALVLVDVDGDDYGNHGLGGAFGFGLSIPLSRDGLRTFIGLEASPSKLRSGLFLPLAARIEAAVPFGSASIGLGLQAGYVVASEEHPTDDTKRPMTSPFLEPYLPIDFWVSDRIGIQLRPGVVFSQQESVSDEAFRLGFFRVGIFLRYAFGSNESPLERAASRMQSHGW